MELSNKEIDRYHKHIQLSEVGVSGQLRLRQTSVLVVGAGGLGSPVLLYLAASGVGNIGIVDGDTVSLSNLQRQVIHPSNAIGKSKVNSALKVLHRRNPEIEIKTFPEMITPQNIDHLMSGYEIVVDCTDNLGARFLINEGCVKRGLPMVYGAVFGFEGQISVFDAKRGPCFRCMYPVIPSREAVPDPKQYGLLSTIPGVVGMLQATEVLKLILNLGDALVGKLLLYDGLEAEFRSVRINKNEDCPVCRTCSL